MAATLLPVMRRLCGGNVRSTLVLAEKLALRDGELVNEKIVEIGQPVCQEDQNLLNVIMRLWREKDPHPVKMEDHVEEENFDTPEELARYIKWLRADSTRLKEIPSYVVAQRERNRRMCRWFDLCFPGHDRWELLRLARQEPQKRHGIKRKIKR